MADQKVAHLRMRLTETHDRLMGVAAGLEAFLVEHVVLPEGADYDAFNGTVEHVHVLIDALRERARGLEDLEGELREYELVPRLERIPGGRA